MANEKVTRLARQGNGKTSQTETTTKKDVGLDILMLILCILVDIIDIGGYFTGPGAAIVWICTTFIFTPLLLIYLHKKDKKHQANARNLESSFGYEDVHKASTITDFRKVTRYMGSSNRLQKAGKLAEAAAKAEEAFKAALKLPKWLRLVAIAAESIPVIEALPLFTIIFIWNYLDSALADKAAQKAAAKK
ncbi:MAG: hypothetical protein WC087_01990 [Candidatus Paceibacterota bacterium]